MKKSVNVRQDAISILIKVHQNEHFVRDLLKNEFSIKNYSKQDTQLLMQILMGVLRNIDYLDHLIINYIKQKKIKLFLKHFFRVSFYQAIFLDKIPERAIISETMKAATHFKLKQQQKAFIRAVLEAFFKDGERYYPVSPYYSALPLHLKYSHPSWIIENWKNVLSSDEISSCLKAGVSIPSLCIFPAGKMTLTDLKDCLCSRKIKYNLLPEICGLKIFRSQSKLHDLFDSGKIYVQGIHQYKAIRLCPARSTDIILEIGAAPGGKTIHLNHLVSECGRLYSIEKNPKRFDLLLKRINIMHLNAVQPVLHDVLLPFPDRVPDEFDHVIIDPPCSNLAELCRRPEVRLRLKQTDICILSALQIKLVKTGWAFLKKGGTLLYITCTLSFKENQFIRDFLIKEKGGILLHEIQTIPTPVDPAGGYAILVRKNCK